MRDANNINDVSNLSINWMGFIFYPKSPRYVRQISSNAGIIPDYSSLEMKNADENDAERIQRVGVFVDDMPQNIVTRVFNYHLDIVQLHGSESPVMIDNLRRTIDPDIRKGIKIMKAISVKSEEDIQRCKEYYGHVDYFLCHTKEQLHFC